MYYFDENGKQLILGEHITSPEQAAYATDDRNSLVFKSVPKNKAIKIVNGEPTYVDVVVDRAGLLAYNKERRDGRIRSGISVTATFYVNEELKTSHTETVRITDRLKSDVESIVVLFKNCPSFTGPASLQVADDIYLVISNATEAEKLFVAGSEHIFLCYVKEREGKAMIKTASEADFVQVNRDLRQHWTQFETNVTL